jgi:hypothetical protein
MLHPASGECDLRHCFHMQHSSAAERMTKGWPGCHGPALQCCACCAAPRRLCFTARCHWSSHLRHVAGSSRACPLMLALARHTGHTQLLRVMESASVQLLHMLSVSCRSTRARLDDEVYNAGATMATSWAAQGSTAGIQVPVTCHAAATHMQATH